MAHRNSESGFALIEVIVSAAVLAIMAMAVLSGIDAASNSSAREKARAVAASLAEQDQERMRAMSVETLRRVKRDAARRAGRRCQLHGQVRGEVGHRRPGGTPSAVIRASNKVEYLHISTTVTSKIVGKERQGDQDRLTRRAERRLEQRPTASLGVKVVDRNGVGVTGVNVSPKMVSPAFAPTSSATDASGCAIFRQVADRRPTRSRSRESGYVDPEGKPSPVAARRSGPGVGRTSRRSRFDVATSASMSTVNDQRAGRRQRPRRSRGRRRSRPRTPAHLGCCATSPTQRGEHRSTAASLYPFQRTRPTRSSPVTARTRTRQ